MPKDGGFEGSASSCCNKGIVLLLVEPATVVAVDTKQPGVAVTATTSCRCYVVGFGGAVIDVAIGVTFGSCGLNCFSIRRARPLRRWW